MEDHGALDPAVLEALAGFDTPTLSNAIETFDIRPRDEGFANIHIRCMFPDMGRMVGYAATASIVARGEGSSEATPLWDHVERTPAPRVVVVEDLDDPPAHGAMWGEVNASVFTALGCVGAVTNGSVRDLDEVRAIGFHFFAGGAGVSHAYQRLVTVGQPVTVGGLRIAPGDLIHADKHGVLLVPQEIAAELPEAARKVIEREQELIRWLRSPEFDSSQLGERRQVRH
ncbi:MAG TPA: RraA family protein [Candidatus Dormibacteraeota bacterium]|jgi:regulator of RNase E activity RraA|nr:RraA family protein [Candidatus Dormibacteraeota bacterium]